MEFELDDPGRLEFLVNRGVGKTRGWRVVILPFHQMPIHAHAPRAIELHAFGFQPVPLIFGQRRVPFGDGERAILGDDAPPRHAIERVHNSPANVTANGRIALGAESAVTGNAANRDSIGGLADLRLDEFVRFDFKLFHDVDTKCT